MKGKQKVIRSDGDELKVVQIKKKKLAEDVIRNLNTSLGNELSMVKTKLINLETREKHMEEEMAKMRKMILDQQSLIKNIIEGDDWDEEGDGHVTPYD